MEEKVAAHLETYLEIYAFVAERSRDIDEIRAFMLENNIPASTAQSRIDAIRKKKLGLFKLNGNMVSINEVEARKLIAEIFAAFEPVTKFNAEDLSKMVELEKENEKLKTSIESMKKAEATDKKRKQNRKRLSSSVLPKVLILDSIKVGPIEKIQDGIFLDKKAGCIAIDEAVAQGAMLKDSFYRELGNEHEMTEANYRRKTFREVFTENRFVKRIAESRYFKKLMSKKKLSMKEKICSRFHISKAEAQGQIDYLTGRALSVQEVLMDNRLTNQEKIALYAFNSPYRNTDMERLLNLAGDECVDANWLISILEMPDICKNYENLRDLIRQCSKASEWAMKKQLAEELIRGEWFITALYEGQETKFQLVPVSELKEIWEILDLEDKDFEYELSIAKGAKPSAEKKSEVLKKSSQPVAEEVKAPQKGSFVQTYPFDEDEVDEADPSVYSFGEKTKEDK